MTAASAEATLAPPPRPFWPPPAESRLAADAKPAPADPKTSPEKPFKRIFLFSDGTGNSSAKLFKTNVWQMYQTIDLGPAEVGANGKADEVVQIAYYNNGVGTSSFRPLAILGGVFGFGLKQNVLNLYRFLCRNYRSGDEILAFGFSRGSFTIRLLIELIATEGILQYNDESEVLQTEADLRRQSADAYRRMLDRWHLNTPLADWVFTRWRRIWRALHRPVARKRWREEPKITFVGLWDTVAAYGGPIAEITRAVDDWIWPLTLPDYKLCPQVQCARHALALDEARDSFQPLLWDETEEPAPAAGAEPRIKQVWFTGMHSDVGGGYPDDSLSYVSLTWMIEELAGRARFIDSAVRHAYDLSNDFGPMHDSRHGLASYYRYQPRRIAALLDPPTDDTLALRDPNIRRTRNGRSEPQGLLKSVHVHESVLRRIINGTDGYAPLALPRALKVVRRKRDTPHAERLPRLPETLQADLDALAAEAARLGRGAPKPKKSETRLYDPLDLLWDHVWKRRLVYFVTVAWSIALASGRWWSDSCTDARCAMSAPISLLKSVLPGFADPWIDGWRAHPIVALALLAAILANMALGTGIEGRLRDATRILWTEATRRSSRATHGARTHAAPPAATAALEPPVLEGAPPTRLARIRMSRPYQRGMQLLKWRWTPKPVGIALLLLIWWALFAVVAQVRIALQEELDLFCADAAIAVDGAPVAQPFDSAALCNPTGRRVRKGVTYRVTFTDLKPAFWQDRGPRGRGVAASPEGIPQARETTAMWIGAPWRRVATSPYFATMALIRGDRGRGLFQLYRPITVLDTGLRCSADGKTCAGAFTARLDGDLSLFTNDAVPPIGPSAWFYRPNLGTARVTAAAAPPAP